MKPGTPVTEEEPHALEEREQRALRVLDAFPSFLAQEQYRRAALDVLVHRLGHQPDPGP